MSRLFALFVLLLLTPALPAQRAAEAAGPAFRAGRVVLQLDAGQSYATFSAAFRQMHPRVPLPLRVRALSEPLGLWLVAVPEGREREMVDAFRQMPQVRAAQLDYEARPRTTRPDDPLYSQQWALEAIGAPDVWDITTGGHAPSGREIVIAVVDGGFDIWHEDLIANIWTNPHEVPGDGIDNDDNGYVDDIYGWNFITDSPEHKVNGSLPNPNHGNNVCGVIGAEGNNALGVAGVNWQVKILPMEGRYVSEIVEAFAYALQLRARYNATQGQEGAFVVAVNGSLGIDQVWCDEIPAWQAMYDQLGQQGILSVAATTNDSLDVDQKGDMPTTCPSEFLITVTASDERDLHVKSGYGATSIDLAAPGRNITTTANDHGYSTGQGGTSMAAPFVAGAIGMLYAMPVAELEALALDDPPAAARLVRDAILQTVAPVPNLEGKSVTAGRLDLFEAMHFLHAWTIARSDEREAGNFYFTYTGYRGLLRVWPNPFAGGELQLTYATPAFEPVTLYVYDMHGRLMYEKEQTTTAFEPQTIRIPDAAAWPAGVYVAALKSDIHPPITQRIVKVP